MTKSVSVSPEMDRLRADYPRWSVWRSEGGDRSAWYATRPETLSDGALVRGCSQTVCGDTADDLRTALEEQADAEDKATAVLGSLT